MTEDLVGGIEPDYRIIRPAPDNPKAQDQCAADMVRSLFAQGAEYYRVALETSNMTIVAEGWRTTPRVAAAYRPPTVDVRSGMAMDLTPMDRARLRNIVRKTHRRYFRDRPSDRMCDELIDSFGPEVAAKMVKAALDAGKVE